jgi:hypothetical protein
MVTYDKTENNLCRLSISNIKDNKKMLCILKGFVNVQIFWITDWHYCYFQLKFIRTDKGKEDITATTNG